MNKIATLTACTSMIALLGCGEQTTSKENKKNDADADASKSAHRQVVSRCEKVKAPLTRALRDALKGDRKLKHLVAVRSEDKFSTPRGLTDGVYFVSGDVRPSPGISTWAVSKQAFETGGGLIFGIDEGARAVSDLGVDANLQTLGLSETNDGFEQSRNCTKSK